MILIMQKKLKNMFGMKVIGVMLQLQLEMHI